MFGSSPLTRGKLDRRDRTRIRFRLIPAHAGKTAGCRGSDDPTAAHPRSRGENRGRRRGGSAPAGSSPLTRGKPHPRRPDMAARRLIPAHAGKTWRPSARGARTAAHPRSRGENPVTMNTNAPKHGSSPLTRGQLSSVKINGASLRLIPAHAGKTNSLNAWSSFFPAHPRSRGENHAGARTRPHPRGSSPLTRGKRRWFHGRASGPRLIPAHAGKTHPAARLHRRAAAHPRSRGENDPTGPVNPANPGSSPLTRGKPRRTNVHTIPRRLIPAHAGKTRSYPDQ